METSGPTSGIPRLAPAPPAAVVQWRVGQVLHATVTDVGIGKALLAIGNRQVSAETSLALHKGEQLMLEVRQLGATPVLRLVTATAEPALAAAIRQLLPAQGALPPLLANLAHLARAPNPPVPPLLAQLVRVMVRELPDVQTVSTAAGVKQAINQSGQFLERQLHNTLAGARSAGIDSDFKANLVRLVQLVRNWPGSPAQAPAPSPPQPAQTTAHANAAPATAPEASPPATERPAVAARPAAPAASGSAASPALIARAVQAATTPAQATAQGPLLQASSGATGAAATAYTPAAQAAVVLPPPLPGASPVPQAAVQASLDLLNRLGNLRADLLQQSEAALARVQLHQLAALPREGDRGLLEWLLELPIRHGDGIDLWSLRITRDPREQHDAASRTPVWSVQLAFDLPGLGPLRARIRLAGDRVSTRFWAEQPATLPLLNAHLDELRRAFAEAGLEVGDLDCQPGAPVADEPRSNPSLISEKA